MLLKIQIPLFIVNLKMFTMVFIVWKDNRFEL
jgi:hypothetical protein